MGILIGGMIVKWFGCIGDLLVIGVGIYVDNESCVVFVIGYGEYFICFYVVVDICSWMKYCNDMLVDVVNIVINDVLVKVEGDGGIIVVDVKGNIVVVFNMVGMYCV